MQRRALRGESGRYALKVVRFSQPEEIQRGDGLPFPQTKRHWQVRRVDIS
jgi:hypothetical protein